MELMHERPDFVKDFVKPKNTEIKYIGGKWYLYERASKYDPETGKSTKVSGKMLGSITEQGLVRKRIAFSHMREMEVFELGASQYFYVKGALIREKLKEFFPDIWREIFSIAVMRLVYDRTLRRCRDHYESSVLSAIFPKLPVSPASLTHLLDRIGKDRGNIRKFMLSMPREGNRFMVVDGHRLLSASRTLENAETGYDSKGRYKPQINLLYVFSLGDGVGYPEYYVQFPGNIPDVSAFSTLLGELGVHEEDCIFLMDKGVGSNDNFELVADSTLYYITPLKRGNLEVRGRVPRSRFDYEQGFLYHGRSIFSKRIECEGHAVHLFLDTSLLNDESADFLARSEKRNAALAVKKERELARREKHKGRLTDEDLAALVPCTLSEEISDKTEMGTISIRTNKISLTSEQVYRIYKQRQSIEQFFKTFDCTLEFNASYMRGNYSLEAWLFLNHLCMTMGIDAMDSIAKLGLTSDISLDDFIHKMRKIQVSKVDGAWYSAKVTKSVNSMCGQLGIELESIEESIKAENRSAP
jgi:transposase